MEIEKPETNSMLQLFELLIRERKYTWSSIKESPSLAKLDRILVSTEWDTKFPLTTVRVCYRMKSDHIPLKLNLEEREKSYK